MVALFLFGSVCLAIILCVADAQTCLDLSAKFKALAITELFTDEIKGPINSISNYWTDNHSHKDFLVAEGDLQLLTTEWVPVNVTLSEDALQLKYTFMRNFSYEHPRTTMLFIGPKNAPAQQVQYLHVGQDGDAIVVTTVTKFTSFPYAENFKVVQYWTVTSSKEHKNKLVVKVGVKVVFIASTMFLIKNQIVSGTESELKVTSERWVRFLSRKLEM